MRLIIGHKDGTRGNYKRISSPCKGRGSVQVHVYLGTYKKSARSFNVKDLRKQYHMRYISTMSQHLQKISSQYHALVHCLGRSSLSYKDLEKFINNNEHMAQPCTKITTVKIYPDVSASPSLHFQDFEGPGQLSHELQSIKQSDGICRLFIVENICPETVVLLGEHFSIDPQFFVDHIKSEPWYRIVNVAKRIPPLPSSQKLHDFLHLRWIETRTLSEFQPAFRTTHIEDVAEEMILRTGGGDELEVESDARSFMWPDKMTTRIPRKAGKLNPRTRTAGEVFQSLLCTRQAATVWFNKTEIGVEGWTGKLYTSQSNQVNAIC